MSNVGKELKAVVDPTMSALGTIEMAHELYGLSATGVLENFFTKFEDKQRKIHDLVNIWGSHDIWRDVEQSLMDTINETGEIFKDVMATYKDFQDATITSGEDLFRKVSDLERFLNSDKVITSGPPQPVNQQQPLGFGQQPILFRPNVEQRYTIEDMFKDVSDTYAVIYRDAERIFQNFASHTAKSNTASNMASRITDNVELRQLLRSVQPALEEIKKLAREVSEVHARIMDKTFDKFVSTFSLDSNDIVKKKMNSTFTLKYKMSEIKSTTSLDNLYSGAYPIDVPLSNALDKVMERIKVIFKPIISKQSETSKRLAVDLQQLKASLDAVKPNNHQGPNFSVNRGIRFVWSELRSKLDSIDKTYGSASSDSADVLDSSIEEQGIFYRKPSLDRLQYYVNVVENFAKDIRHQGDDGETGNLVRSFLSSYKVIIDRAMTAVTDANDQAASISEKYQDDIAYVHHQKQRLALKKLTVIEHYLREVKRIFVRYMQLHMDFALKTNRQGMRYVSYWKAVDIANDEARKYIEEYENVLRVDSNSVVSTGNTTVVFLRQECLLNFFKESNSKAILADMTSDMAEKVNDKFNSIDEWVMDTVTPRIANIHNGPPNIFDVLSDSQIVMLYALKLIRFGLVVLSLSIARRSFQAIYNEKVYNRNSDPPHPAMMIAMFVGIELAFAVIVMITLTFLKYLFYHGPGTFFIDKYIMSRWLLDYVLSTLIITVIAFIMADVIRKRKYFRYRYEGERGVRALEAMVRWTAGIVLCLPFYRMAD